MATLPGRQAICVGRSEECDICVPEPSVSRVHAVFRIHEDGRLFVVDADSRNGTFLNGERIDSVGSNELRAGDRVRIGGDTLLQVSVFDEMDAKFHADLYDAAVRDPMTGAFNKRYLMENLSRELALSARHGLPVSLLMLDVDHFKQVNDRHGHLGGDAVLTKLVQTTQQLLRTEDLLARYGGEEFAIVTKNQTTVQAVQLGERIRRTIEGTSFTFSNETIPVTLSIGVGTSGGLGAKMDPDALIAEADARLYDAKRSGRNQVR